MWVPQGMAQGWGHQAPTGVQGRRQQGWVGDPRSPLARWHAPERDQGALEALAVLLVGAVGGSSDPLCSDDSMRLGLCPQDRDCLLPCY